MGIRSFIPRGGFGFRRGGRSKDKLRANLAAYYRLDDTSDRSPNAYALTNTGSVSFADDGLAGKCATFNGSNYLTITGAAAPGLSPSISTKFTIAALWRVTSVAASQSIVSKGGSASREWGLYYFTGNGILFEIGDGASGTRLSLGDYSFGGASGNVNANEYTLTFAWFDPDASTHGSMSIQGCKVGAGQTTLNTSNTQPIANPRGAPNTGRFEIGRRYEGSFPLTGRVDSVAIWTGRILTLDERNAILSRTLAGAEWIK